MGNDLGWPSPMQGRTYPYKGKKYFYLLTTVQKEQAPKSTVDISEYVVFSHVDDRAFADLSREDNYSDEDDYDDYDEGGNNYDIIPTLIKDYSRLHDRLVIKTTINGSPRTAPQPARATHQQSSA